MKRVGVRDDDDDGGVEFQQGCLSGAWNAGSAPVREFWKGKRRKRSNDSVALLTDVCVCICIWGRGGRVKEGFFTWSDQALVWSSVLSFGVGRSGGV